MNKIKIMQVLAALSFATMSWASGGDSGTGAVAEMSVSGGQFMMMVGALVALGVVIWLLAKFLNK